MNILQTWALVMVVSQPTTTPATNEAMFKECQRVARYLETTYLPLMKKEGPEISVKILCTSKTP